ncbi:MAG: hypothetical protein MI921_27630 [Cytophagales bacterium]|nr:hypothetical protein [Cytophagales bacterium]
MKHNFEDTTFFQLKFPIDTKLDWRRLKVRVDYPNVYVMEGTTPVMFYSRLPSLEMKETDLDKTFFTESIPLSSNSAILKVFDRRLEQYVLTKKIAKVPYNTPKSSILEKQVEGRFSVDGLLKFEPETSSLVYLYYYRNQFISLDTALNIVYKGSTIDTVTKAQINVAHLKSESSYTMSSPSLLVNKRLCLTPDFIFIQSARKADNEDQKSFKQSVVIDAYAIKNGDYQFSFYLPNFKKSKLRDFMIYNDRLVAIFDQYLCTYRLKFSSEIF